MMLERIRSAFFRTVISIIVNYMLTNNLNFLF